MSTVVGIVGYFQFLRGYPLGPELMTRLRTAPWAKGLDIREMNWGPIAIVQDFQAQSVRPDRVVLIGAVDRGLPSGTVSCHRWVGGTLDPLAVQRRVFEGVTGVISLDNLIVIGAHFGVWPDDLLTVEMQARESDVSELVLGEIESGRARGSAEVIGEQPPTQARLRIVERLVEAVRQAVLDEWTAEVQPLSIDQMAPAAAFSHHRFFDEPA